MTTERLARVLEVFFAAHIEHLLYRYPSRKQPGSQLLLSTCGGEAYGSNDDLKLVILPILLSRSPIILGHTSMIVASSNIIILLELHCDFLALVSRGAIDDPTSSPLLCTDETDNLFEQFFLLWSDFVVQVRPIEGLFELFATLNT